MNVEENVQCSSSTSHQNIRLSLVPQASPHDLSASFSRDLIIINNRCHPKHFNKKSEIAIIIVKKCLIKVPQNGQCPNLGWVSPLLPQQAAARVNFSDSSFSCVLRRRRLLHFCHCLVVFLLAFKIKILLKTIAGKTPLNKGLHKTK
jgi:hypothetical protein